MSSQDITVKMQNGRFNYRVGAIIISSNKMLLVKNSGDPFFYTVGGRVKLGETARDTVLREAYEETGIKFEIDRLAFIHENFFVMDSSNEPYHEVSFFFLMKENDIAVELLKHSFQEEYAEVTTHWIPIDDLAGLHVYPEFFKTEIKNLTGGIKHFISKAGMTYLQK
jgi:ADP-ribose pyrophosphatase YjhB (NUDIX family)